APVAVAQEDRNVVVRGEEIGDGQVEFAVAVEVADRAAGRRVLQPKLQGSLKGPVPVARDERNTVGVLATVNEVQMTVAGKIADEHELSGSIGREAHLVLEGAVAVAQQDGNVRGVTVGRDQIQLTVLVDVGRSE